MAQADWQQVLQQARAEGILPAAAQDGPHERPWPMVLLTGLGAWLAAIPIFLLFAYIFRDFLQSGAVIGLLGTVLVWVACSVLRAREVPLFAEQFAIPLLLAGLGMLGVAMHQLLPERGMFGGLLLILLALGWALPQHWLRVLLGAGALLMAMLCWQGNDDFALLATSGPVLLLLWLAALGWQQQALSRAQWRHALVLESLGSGWVLALLLQLALSFGSLWMADGVADGGRSFSGEDARWSYGLLALSVGQVLLGAVLLVKRWPQLRQPWCLGVALVLMVLAALMKPLGSVLLIAAVCLSGQCWRLAVAAAMAALWIIGAFYYLLDLTLVVKAGILLALAAALGGLSWLAGARLPWLPVPDGGAPASEAVVALAGCSRWQRPVIALSVVAILLVANAGIWQKETLIRNGQPLFVALAPADPRSLMQGDYMALNFQSLRPEAGQAELVFDRQQMVFQRDARGVAIAVRANDGQTLAADELAVELVFKHGRWLLVTDAFFFKEGEAARWAKARYGEFRVDNNGKALLVGLRGEGLAPL